jgi:GH15 family glucan-1,4-alpha-glucosidase
MRSELAPRFEFGRAVPRITTGVSSTKMFAGPDALYLRGGPVAGAPSLLADFSVSAGQEVSYTLAYATSYDPPTGPQDLAELERATEDFWMAWCAKLEVPARYRELVVRSLITLKACIFEPTGGLVAAPTTSLPEAPGGERNWDYRFCWIRDGALSVRALVAAGLHDEARSFLDWCLRAIAGDPQQVQIMYGLRGERRLSEVELGWLNGYEGARPVRVGNAAYEQHQLDIFGEIAILIYEVGRLLDGARTEAVRAMLAIARYVAKIWRIPDRGIWEMRGPERSFTASKVSAWTALDRAIRLVEECGVPEAIEDLRAERKTIFDEVCAQGWNSQLGTFTQYYGGTGLDASLLFIPLTGFLPASDPRVAGTVAAIERELLKDGLVLRYVPEEGVDGLKGEEGVFLACSFWLVGVYQLMGRTEDARRLFDRLAALANDVGLLAEEYEPRLRRQLGNFPQAFSHFALVNAALALAAGEPMAPALH